MTQNLNLKTDSSFCYDNVDSNCTKYGRLYRWAAAVNKSESDCGLGNVCSLPSGNVQGICPSGWHLPSKNEWETLFATVGGQSSAGRKLKSTSGWYNSGNGTNTFLFSAFPAGYRISSRSYNSVSNDAHFLTEGRDAYFWSSTEDSSNFAYRMCLNYDSDVACLGIDSKDLGCSIRCLKDDTLGQAQLSPVAQ